jgi:hypothetical protein
MGAIICDFGKTVEGLRLYRINGDKKEIEKYIEELRHLGCEFHDEIELEKTWKQYSVLLKLQFPSALEEEMQKKERELEEQRAKTNAIRDRLKAKQESQGE